MLAKVRTLIEELDARRVRYCHWKSNSMLADSVAGKTDIDLLIHREDAGQFRIALNRLCFLPTTVGRLESFPSMEHHFALDENSGVLIHVHAYFRVITGESLTKNYHLPVEEMLLHNTREECAVRVPTKSAELVVFTIRMMLKHTSLLELVLLARYWSQVGTELEWLLDDEPIDDTLTLVEHWLPALDGDLFASCIAALRKPAPLLRRIALGFQLRSQLSPYARSSTLRARLSGAKRFAAMLSERLTGSKVAMVPKSGGVVIAFVGSEATGKSTLLAETKAWLGEHFNVDHIHVGKPNSTLLTIVPNLLVPALRRLLPSYRSTRVVKEHVVSKEIEESRRSYPLVFALRSLLLAYDRRALLTRAFARAAAGTIVLCDRYPSSRNGAPDGPQLSPLAGRQNGQIIRGLLARLEATLYGDIPPPDLVVHLYAPLEVTLSRNQDRNKTEPEEYVRWRHARSANLTFDQIPVHRINTDQPIAQTVLDVKRTIWESLNV